MADVNPMGKALFLREEELRRGIEMMFFAYRDFTGEADAILAEQDMGRAHHRAIYFIGRNSGMTVSALLSILNITKQSLSRVLSALVESGHVVQRPGPQDRRQRLLFLTKKGSELEARLTDVQATRFARAYREAGMDSVVGFHRVLEGLLDPQTRIQVNAPEIHVADNDTG